MAGAAGMSSVSELASASRGDRRRDEGQRFPDKQIIGVLDEAEQAGNIRDVCKRNDTTETTFWRWLELPRFRGVSVAWDR